MCLQVYKDTCNDVQSVVLVASNYLWWYCLQMYSWILVITSVKIRIWKTRYFFA